MDKGKIQQIGTPEDIYNEPVNAFVADFIGESNIVDGCDGAGLCVCDFGGVTGLTAWTSGFAPNEVVEAVVRPEDVIVCAPRSIRHALTGTALPMWCSWVCIFEIFVDVGGFKWMVQTTRLPRGGQYRGYVY